MKTNKIFMLAIAAGAMFLGSCSNDDELKQIEESAEPATMVFTATMENAGEATRTVLSGNAVYWSSLDKITILNDQNDKSEFTASDADGTSTSCSFVGTVNAGSTYYAVYPTQSDAVLSGSNINGVTLPAEQTAVAGSYDPAAALMVAKSTSTDLHFKNLNTLIKVTPQFGCTKIIIEANGGTQIAGKVNVTTDSTWVATGTAGDAKSKVTLSGDIEPGKDYYIAILPTKASSGFTITCCAIESDADGHLGFYKSKSSEQIFTRNEIMNAGSFCNDGTQAIFTSYIDGQPNMSSANAGYKTIIDLGITSGDKNLYWAKYNVGAGESEPFGSYFNWGDTVALFTGSTKTGSAVGSWLSGYEAGYTSGNYTTHNQGSSLTGNIDPDATPCYDAARVHMGGNWRMPTSAEIGYLRQQCVWIFGEETYGGQTCKGYKIYRAKKSADAGMIYTSGNTWINASGADGTDLTADYITGYTQAHLFLPSSGYFYGANFNRNSGTRGDYWSATYSNDASACSLLFNGGAVQAPRNDLRYCGRAVRGVVCQ